MGSAHAQVRTCNPHSAVGTVSSVAFECFGRDGRWRRVAVPTRLFHRSHIDNAVQPVPVSQCVAQTSVGPISHAFS